MPKVLTSAKRQEEERKDIKIGKEGKHSLFEDHIIFYVESSKKLKQKTNRTKT